MLTDIWSFLQDENNRDVLAWIGGGIVVVVGAVWTVLKFVLSKRRGESAPAPTMTATRGGIAAGRDIRNTKIDTRDVVIQGPASAYSSGQTGGVTAGTYINEAPAPELKLVGNKNTQNSDGTHMRVIRVEVVSAYKPGELILSAETPNIISGDIHPVDAGMIQFGQALTAEHYTVTVNGPTGRYDLVLKTPKHEIINLRYAFR